MRRKRTTQCPRGPWYSSATNAAGWMHARMYAGVRVHGRWRLGAGAIVRGRARAQAARRHAAQLRASSYIPFTLTRLLPFPAQRCGGLLLLCSRNRVSRRDCSVWFWPVSARARARSTCLPFSLRAPLRLPPACPAAGPPSSSLKRSRGACLPPLGLWQWWCKQTWRPRPRTMGMGRPSTRSSVNAATWYFCMHMSGVGGRGLGVGG